jgi:hypothetical protein
MFRDGPLETEKKIEHGKQKKKFEHEKIEHNFINVTKAI